jgi:hypothetical protein
MVLLVVLLIAMMSLPLVMVYSAFEKEKRSDAWRMLLPLNPQGLLREAPRNKTTANENVTVAMSKETGSLKLRSGADVLAFSPMGLVPY